MAMICLFGICVPYTALFPLLFMIIKPLLTLLGLWPLIESLIGSKRSTKSDKVSEAVSDLSSCCTVPLNDSTESKDITYTGEYLTDRTQWSQVIDNDRFTLIRFSASWCKPCKAIEPLYFSLVGPDKIRSISIDIDEHDEIASTANVIVLPTFQIYQDGNCIESMTSSDAEKLKALVAKYSPKQENLLIT